VASAHPQKSDVSAMMMMFAGIAGSIVVTLYVVKLVLKGNGDSPSNYF
jgi:hypothetical protein